MTNQTIQHYNPLPGEHLVDELDELGMSRADLARSASRATGSRRSSGAGEASAPIPRCAWPDGSMARWLDTSPQMWLNLQAIHDLRKAEDEHGAEIRESVTPLARSQTG